MEQILILIIALLLISFLYFCNQAAPEIKGFEGEQNVSAILHKLDSSEYIIMNDVIIPTFYGSTQIDHIVVSLYGIFVIETKNMQGWILGSPNGAEWTQKIYGKKYNFRNPLLQNNGHIKALSSLLKIRKEAFISIVTFSKNSEIKIKTDQHVIYFNNLLNTIHLYEEKKFDDTQIQEIANSIRTSKLSTAADHEKQVQTAQHAKQMDKKNTGNCPYCGGHLVKRTGKYGDFFGCSGYPNCRYTRKINKTS